MVRFFRRKKEEGPLPGGQAPGVEVPEKPEVEAPAAELVAGAEAGGPAPDALGDVREEAAGVREAVERSRQGWFGRIGGIFRRSGLTDELWDELEETLIAADTGVPTTLKILNHVKERVREERVRDPEEALGILKDEMVRILEVDSDRGRIWSPNGRRQEMPRPAVILVVGVNGTGKTTNIAKLAYAYRNEGKKLILAAGDTFRAAAIEQLKHWGRAIGVDVVAHQQGADPGAVVFDTLQAAESREADIVIIDTAGRLHTKANLMEELRKVNRIIQRKIPDAPHEVLLVIDATTGQNAMPQAKYFTEAVGVTAILLSKLDGTAKGGVVFSVCDQLGVPVRFIGAGERAQDLAPFDPKAFVEALLAP
jgi:fused signal recognition particle receptor